MSQSPIVVILAAGQGTRMKSERPKVLHEVAGRPLIIWSIETARAANAARIVAVVGHQADRVRDAIDRRYGAGAVETVLQAERRGTGHAVMCALSVLAGESDDRVVVVLSGDAPLVSADRVRELVAACDDMALAVTRPTEPVAYGRVVRRADGRVDRIVEDADATPEERAIEEMNAGLYAIRLGKLRADIGRLTDDNAQGELYLTDLAPGAAAIEAPFDEVRGINDRADLAAVNAIARRSIAQRWMRAGVTLEDPVATYIDADVDAIGGDTWIGSGVHLRGRTSVGARVRIDAGCIVQDSAIADDAWLKPYSVLTEASVGARAQVGPFAHCRPGTRLDEDVRVGNFVETKKAHLMKGAKANHLAYLGDASVGARANIGAGTITCNYDGVKKYQTVIEAGAFIGSDSQLVAPVTIGRDAYVGSGTTVTKDVPRGALALSRVKQHNIDGWADRFRAAQAKRTSSR
ncbi:MAG: UDP-N-acetylglucosamine diphosphorylase/glucosamine-1-phosphate N-acetyltransferase [Deltaproteobacteria bacterium]|nr:MAG: UDP-N-acetylglucosamine diphosphorylase/glucosamine-1-phosphate N-acetyltransferase [Deltaproteobacteria bacterium]